ncbi:sel1 repeat family protein [Neiella sp. HB171785]|uniref:Sel1 repeat family protein n=1 Tax=Neiella litorisoli TaxID=2771431 RepID=A0A8J6QIV3_9GAMM|nr:SEL1-like repeat protein [Neiella litorisoli]MBD1389618.1 sel1 repeat family protein [Neiella litorisoli]
MSKQLLAAIMIALPCSVSAADVLKADRLYKESNYPQAIVEYEKAADLGLAHAYYQLAVMHNFGKGTEQDSLNALIYFSMAADQNYHDAAKMVDKMLAKLPADNRAEINAVLAKVKAQLQQNNNATTYNPAINPQHIGKRVTFGGKQELQQRFHPDDWETDSLYEFLEESAEYSGESAFMMSTPSKPFLIVDNDISADGTVRNLSEIQRFGWTKTLVDNYALFPGDKPEFEGEPVEFVNRAYLGSAAFNRDGLRADNEKLYESIRRHVYKLKDGTTLNERYEYAIALLNFSWISREEGEVEQRLLALAKEGHPSAMYEYGMKLYREQKDIEVAVHWITQASKYGLARAEYRLGKLLQTSPWVIHDDRKALFWYQSAMDKDHLAATLRAIDIKLNSSDASLRDLDGAIAYLEQIKESHNRHPEYFYLLAVSHINREGRDFTQVVKNMRQAISEGQRKNWDVSAWQYHLDQLTEGNVYIIEES